MSHSDDLNSFLRSSRATSSRPTFSDLYPSVSSPFRKCISLRIMRLLPTTHNIVDAATSHLLPIRAFLITRLLISSVFTMTIVLYTATSHLVFHTFTAWVYTLAWFTSLLLCFTSLHHLISLNIATEVHTVFTWLPNLAIPLRLMVVSSSAVLDLIFWLVLRPHNQSFQSHDLIIHLSNFVLPLLDLTLSLPISFPISYVPYTAFFPSLWLIFIWINYLISHTWPYPELDVHIDLLRSILMQLAFVLAPLLITLSIFIINEILTTHPMLPIANDISRNASASVGQNIAYASARDLFEDDSLESTSSDSSAHVDFDKYVSSRSIHALNSTITSVAAPLPVFLPVSSCCHFDPDASCRSSHCSSVTPRMNNDEIITV